jgi:hypothetical protein
MGDQRGRPKKIKDFSKVINTFSSLYNDTHDDETTVPEEERKKRQEKAAQVSDS